MTKVRHWNSSYCFSNSQSNLFIWRHIIRRSCSWSLADDHSFFSIRTFFFYDLDQLLRNIVSAFQIFNRLWGLLTDIIFYRKGFCSFGDNQIYFTVFTTLTISWWICLDDLTFRHFITVVLLDFSYLKTLSSNGRTGFCHCLSCYIWNRSIGRTLVDQKEEGCKN